MVGWALSEHRRLLQRRGAVTIYARLPPATTSNIAGGQWSPYSVFDPIKLSAFREQFGRAARLANRYYQDMVGDYYGVRWIENYILSQEPLRSGGGAPFGLDGLFPESRLLAKSEHPFPVPYVSRFTTMLIEPPVYLNAVLRDFLLAAAKSWSANSPARSVPVAARAGNPQLHRSGRKGCSRTKI